MKNSKRPKLPRGLRWKSGSPFIWFSWRDARGKQHQKNTDTSDPAKALGTKLEFLANEQREIEEIKSRSENITKLPLQRMQSRYYRNGQDAKWNVNQPMFSWTRSWRKLVAESGMPGLRFHDLRHTFRTWGAEAGVPLEVMMAQLGHMNLELRVGNWQHVKAVAVR
jgi:integrase